MEKENRKEFEKGMFSEVCRILGAVESLAWKYENENSNKISKNELQKDLIGLNKIIEFLEKKIGSTKFQLPYIEYPEFAKKIISKLEEMLGSLYKTKDAIERLIKE